MSPLQREALRRARIKPPPPGPFAPPHLPPGEFRTPRLGGKVTPVTPELDRMHKVTGESQVIGEFIEWLKSQSGFVLARWTNEPRRVRCPECMETYYDESCDDALVPEFIGTERLLALYYDINLDTIEEERMRLLDHLREVQDIA